MAPPTLSVWGGSTGGMKSFAVAGAVLKQDAGFLWVCNRRKNGRTDWSPPGGIIDPGEQPLQALTREVVEETGLQIQSYGSLLYRVQVDFEPLGWRLNAQVHRVEEWTGDLVVDDPDNVVIDAGFFDGDALHDVLGKSPRWVAEPFRTVCLADPADVPRTVSGDDGDDAVPEWRFRAVRTEPDGGFQVDLLP